MSTVSQFTAINDPCNFLESIYHGAHFLQSARIVGLVWEDGRQNHFVSEIQKSSLYSLSVLAQVIKVAQLTFCSSRQNLDLVTEEKAFYWKGLVDHVGHTLIGTGFYYFYKEVRSRFYGANISLMPCNMVQKCLSAFIPIIIVNTHLLKDLKRATIFNAGAKEKLAHYLIDDAPHRAVQVFKDENLSTFIDLRKFLGKGLIEYLFDNPNLFPFLDYLLNKEGYPLEAFRNQFAEKGNSLFFNLLLKGIHFNDYRSFLLVLSKLKEEVNFYSEEKDMLTPFLTSLLKKNKRIAMAILEHPFFDAQKAVEHAIKHEVDLEKFIVHAGLKDLWLHIRSKQGGKEPIVVHSIKSEKNSKQVRGVEKIKKLKVDEDLTLFSLSMSKIVESQVSNCQKFKLSSNQKEGNASIVLVDPKTGCLYIKN